MLSNNSKKVKILLTGGGTGGSVSPLLAIAEELRFSQEGDFEFFWLGTKTGPEREMVEKERIGFKAIHGGKLRRYFSWKNLLDLLFVKLGFWEAFFFIWGWKPDLVVTAGSFVSVPVVWAAWILRVPVLVHQMDARPGLANRLMAPFAKVITVTFEKSLSDYGKKAVWVGSPIRQSLKTSIDQENYFNLKKDLPVVFVLGGGTGAQAINELIWKNLNNLTEFCQIIHQTGRGKNIGHREEPIGRRGDPGNAVTPSVFKSDNYQSFEFLNVEQMAAAYAVADAVISRCGMGVLTELAFLGKPAILIPMPNSHQEDNAKIFEEKKAAVILDQRGLAAGTLKDEIVELLGDKEKKAALSRNIRQIFKQNPGQEIVRIIEDLLRKN